MQITVKELYEALGVLVRNGEGDKKIIIADDNEGNGYHGAYFTVTAKPKNVKECIDSSNGLYDSQEEDPNNLVIVG